jgi:drug/metabolite transporter (DMT)-like permease
VIISTVTSVGIAPIVVAAVIFAAMLHASWNAMAHRIPDQAVGFALIGIACAAVSVCFVPWVAFPSGRAWPFLLTSAALHVVYSLLLLRCYQIGDFSQTYPLARGTSPLVVTLVAVTVVGQPLGARQAVGVLVICAGLVTLALGSGQVRHAAGPAVRAAVATGLAIAAYTVVDGVGVRRSDSTTGYIAWLFLLQGPIIAIAVLARHRRSFTEVRPVLAIGLFSGVVSVVAYGIVIWAQTRSMLATVSALRELSILFGALIGVFFFRERFGRQRLLGATLAVIGVILIAG